MRRLQFSSGDLVADRRAVFAAALAADRDFPAAADLMMQVLELAPAWTAGWHLLGQYREEAGDIAGAVAAWQRVEALDAEGVFGASLKLAAHGGGAPVPVASYVEALFDDYAPRFETELVSRLGYDAPSLLEGLLASVLGDVGSGQVGHAIDLGCGTGLMGERLRRRASFLEGVDLSAGMIALAERKGIYDRLEKGELTAFLHQHAGGVDLLAAADVLNYCGELPPVLAAAYRVLAPDGLFAFTVERHHGPEPVLIRPSMRFAHNTAATRAACEAAGFDVVAAEEAVLRHDRGEPIDGVLMVLRRPVVAEMPVLLAEDPIFATLVPDA